MDNYSISDLHKIAEQMTIVLAKKQSKPALINIIENDLKKYKNIGHEGKDGIVYFDGKYATKTFKKTKSENAIKREVEFQRLSHEISPKIIKYSCEMKYITMEKLTHNLLDILKKQNRVLTLEQQKSIIDLSGEGPFKKVESTDMIGGRKSKSKCKSRKNKKNRNNIKSRKNKNDKKSKCK